MTAPPNRRWSRLAAWVFALAVVVYMILIPMAEIVMEQFRGPQYSGRERDDLSFADYVRLRTTEAITGVWFFSLGATIGSFLNVVVYRVPRGESVIFRRSRCPTCGGQIAGRDNVPIVGWLMLGGRCRACGGEISPRYPIVETLTALIFLLFYAVELLSGGANIPIRQPNLYTGVVWIVFYTKWDLIGLYFYHCYLLSTLLSWAIIQLDGNRVPHRTGLVALLLAVLPPLVWPHLLPVTFTQPLPDPIATIPWLAACITCCVGACGGIVLCGVSTVLSRLSNSDRRLDHLDSPLALVLLGVGLGWQAVLAIFLISVMLNLMLLLVTRLARLVRHSRFPSLMNLFIATVTHHIFWRWVSMNLSPW